MTDPKTPAPSTAAQISAWLSDWQHVILILGSLAIATVAGIFIPGARWAALWNVITEVAAHPAEATAAISMFVGAVASLRGAWMRTPPTTLLVLAFLALATSGCGATALQQQAVGVTVGLRVVKALDDAYIADESARIDACNATVESTMAASSVTTHDECVHTEHDRYHALELALDSLHTAVLAWGAAIAVAADIDAGASPPDAVLASLNQVLAVYDQAVVLARASHIDIPPWLDGAISGLMAMMGSRPAPTSSIYGVRLAVLPMLHVEAL